MGKLGAPLWFRIGSWLFGRRLAAEDGGVRITGRVWFGRIYIIREEPAKACRSCFPV